MATVYLLRNTTNGTEYVGVTLKTSRQRFREHVAEAQKGSRRRICKAIRKHGAEQFTIIDLACGLTSEAARQMEIAEIAKRLAQGAPIYNATFGGEPFAGTPKPEWFRRSVSESLKGRAKSPEHIAKIAAALTGKRLSDETKAKIREARSRQLFSSEAVEKRTAKLRGRKQTERAIANMAAAQKGRPKAKSHRMAISRSISRLCEEQVRYIRANPDGLMGKELAAMFGISQQNVCCIRKGRAYKHLLDHGDAINSGANSGLIAKAA